MLTLTKGLKYLRNLNKISSSLVITNKKFYSNRDDEKRNPVISKGVKLYPG